MDGLVFGVEERGIQSRVLIEVLSWGISVFLCSFELCLSICSGCLPFKLEHHFFFSIVSIYENVVIICLIQFMWFEERDVRLSGFLGQRFQFPTSKNFKGACSADCFPLTHEGSSLSAALCFLSVLCPLPTQRHYNNVLSFPSKASDSSTLYSRAPIKAMQCNKERNLFLHNLRPQQSTPLRYDQYHIITGIS